MHTEETVPETPVLAPQATGRRLVVFEKGAEKEAAKLLNRTANRSPVVATEYGSVAKAVQASNSEGSSIVLPRFGVAAIGGRQQESASLVEALQVEGLIADSRPEFWMFALSGPPWHEDANRTWGLSATDADAGAYSGSGIKVAVLDTGFDLAHPDYQARTITHESFVAGESVDDVQGHGTHCAGTAVGSTPPTSNVPRYGVAPDAELFVAKVLNNRGSGRELDIIAGIEWAIENECEVISMSLGRAVGVQEPYDPLYEAIAADALDAGSLIVAAAGNESDRRYGYVAPVGSPANAPSIMAVAAIESDGGVAPYSCGGIGTGEVTIAAPGSGVLSSFPHPELYKRLPGTSMACPHVAGIAALWAQSDPNLRGQKLWDKLISTAVPLPGQNATDFGQGLVKAP